MTYPAPVTEPRKDGNGPRTESSAESPQPKAGLIEKCRIVDVNVKDYTVTTSTEHTYKKRFDVPFGVPYCNFDTGEGINFMPEVGSYCYVFTPSEDKGTEFVFGWFVPDDDQGRYRGQRPLLNPGDIHISTKDGNFVVVRRGGVTQIGATPICQMIFLPIRNVVELFFENLGFHGVPGDLSWTVARQDEDGGGHQATLLTLECCQFADDPNTNRLVRLRAGNHGSGDSTVFSLETRDSGGGSIKSTLTIDTSGNISWQTNKVTITAQSDVSLATQGKMTAQSQGDMSLTSQGNFAASGSSQASLAAGNSQLALSSSGAALSGQAITLNNGTLDALRNAPDLATWIQVVTKALSVPGVGNPVLGVAITPPTQHTNPTVKL